MKHVFRRLAAASLLCLALARGSAAAPALPSGIAYGELGQQIEEFVSAHADTTAGMAVSVFHRDGPIYTGHFGYADKEKGLAVDQDTVMEWGSATKLLVWVSVMQLWERGLIDLEADVRGYLPDGFLTNLNYDAPITMLHLMDHNAGFQDVYADLFVKGEGALPSLEDALKAHAPEQIYEPGSVTAYSNWGVALAAYIVEQVSGETFDGYVHRHIFDVLGMEHSALLPDLSDDPWVRDKRKELQCYTTDGALIPDCFWSIPLYPAGMCTSTLADFEAFGRALLDEGSPLFRERDTWQALFTPTAYLGDSDQPSNLHGFWVVPHGVATVGHGGNTAGCSSYLLLDLENRIGAVVMTNQSNETVYNSEMMELIFGTFSAQDYFAAERSMPEGVYRSARTMRVGPFKLISFSFTSGGWEQDAFWMTGTDNGVELVCYPYADFVRVPVWQFVLEAALVLLWAAAALFSVATLIAVPVGKLVRARRKQPAAAPLGKWGALAAGTQVAAVASCAVMAALALSYARAATYTWISAAMCGAALFMLGLILYGIARRPKAGASRGRRYHHLATIVLLAASVANILYWNLFMWWKI